MKNRFLIILSAMALALALAGCATFEGDIPVDAGWDVAWLSPANGDGVFDELNIDVDVPQIKGLRIQAYRFVVTDNLGRTTFVIEDSLPAGGGGRGNMDSLDVPKAFVWDGRTSQGAWAPDGEYKFRIEATGQKGAKGSSTEGMVIVDNTAPYLVLSVPFLSFSPNGDGRQDVLPVYLVDASAEDLWEGEIRGSDGQVVRSSSWEGLPRSSEWDGTDQNGRRLPDGLYEYRVSSTDKAGNAFVLDLSGIRLDTSPSRLTLERSEAVISPNGDGVLDSLSLAPDLQRADGLISWELAVVDTGGKVLKTWSGSNVPAPVVFDGRDAAGRLLVDGDYYGILSAEYANGDAPRTASDKFTVDTTAPTAVFSADYLLFSPDGDGRRDSVTVNQSSSVEDAWTARILDSQGRVVRTGEWATRLTPFEWDGRDAAGRTAADGLYTYEARAVDRGGNAYVGGVRGLRVDTRPTPVNVRTSARGLSPNGDGTAETILFIPAPAIRDGISGWTFQALNKTEGVSWNLDGVPGQAPPEAIEWDGRTDSGTVVDGRYTVSMTVDYEKGNRTVGVLETEVVVDTTPPVLRVSAAPLPFSPDGDGFADILTITPAADDVSDIVSWSAAIQDPRGTPFFLRESSGSPAPFQWNGRGTGGDLVLSAEDYGITVEAVDAFGNRGRVSGKIPVDILVIREGDRLRISISSIYFKPYTADYRNIDPELARKNLETLDRLAQVLKKYPEHRIRLEGHAVRTLWYDENLWRTEERDKLAPLSTERAEAIRDALIRRGIASSRMSTEGFGGTRPLVPHSDEVNRWKNRRVEFLLVR